MSQNCKLGHACDQFKHFFNTGYDGSHIWKQIHDIPKKIECAECSSHADFNLKGLHDHVNSGLLKKPFNPQLYSNWVKEVNDVYDQCVKDGRCNA